MKHLFVPYELAVKLKEKGFNEECIAYWDATDKTDIEFCLEGEITKDIIGVKKGKFPLAPLYQQVVDWLELKGIYIDIQCSYYSQPIWWDWNIEYPIKNKTILSGEEESYPEKYPCLTKAIEESLKLI